MSQKRLMVIAALLALGNGLVLSGCSAMAKPGATASNDRTDWDTVNEVSRVARDRGIGVIWINMPQKKRGESEKK